jgi:hypothetical protein
MESAASFTPSSMLSSGLLAAEHAAVAAAERVRHVDPAFLLRDLFLAEGRIGMREIGRAAHHRDDLAGVLDLLAKARPVFLIGHLQEARIPFQPCTSSVEASLIHSETVIVPSLQRATMKAFGKAARRGMVADCRGDSCEV